MHVNKLDTFFVPYSDVIVPPKRFSWVFILTILFVAAAAGVFFHQFKFKKVPKQQLEIPETMPSVEERVYPSQPLERLGVKLKDVMLEEGVTPQIIANTVAFVVRSTLRQTSVSAPMVAPSVAPISAPTEVNTRRVIPDLPTTKPKRKG